ncbi:hypothetical protein Moror_11906 [Moniliophthora roreri MCA 2997]|uniref:Uncharacterized protein n=1 Tax=Moniliophthora roreri (strain MCA 2997) TaxID=1381753 RepID=V2Y616_MONRO|nr:hypothetical protein Moror_11906 [Moniliophthora roreri MCA 2997]
MQFKNLLFAAALAVCAAASPHERRGVWNPPITSPDAKTVWCVGKKVKVTWHVFVIPDHANFPKNSDTPAIILHKVSDPNLCKFFLFICSESTFKLEKGTVDITVPDVKDGKDYTITLFGDSGNKSPNFTIQHCGVKREAEEDED